MFLRAFIKRYCTWTKKYFINCLFSKIENFGVKKSSPLLLPLKFWCQFFGGWGFYTPCPPLPLPDSHRFNLSAIIWDGRFRHPCQLLGHPTNAGGDETPQKKDERKCRFRKKNISGGGGRVWCEFLFGGVVSKKEIFLFEGSKSKSLEQQSFWGICLEERWWFLGY